MALSILVDHSQTRLTADELGVAASGLEWNGSVWSATWIDPVTRTLMLRPRALDTEWYTTSSGDYAKDGLADFSTGSGWEERTDQHWAGPWIARKDSATGGTAVSLASLGKNRGLVMSWFSYGSGDTFLQLKVGWSNGGSDVAGVALHFWTDGTVDVLKDGATVGQGRISGSVGSDVRRHQVYEVVLVPMRGRELLVYSKSGRGFSHVFTDIDPEDADPTITPGEKYWFEVVAGGAQVQIAPLKFAASGFATSLETSLAEAPLAGESLVEFDNLTLGSASDPFKVYGYPAFGLGIESVDVSLTELDGSTAFSPDGTAVDCRLRADLSATDAGYSPFVFGGRVAYASQSGATASVGGTDVTGAVLACTLSVPDDASRVSLDLGLADPEALEVLVPGLVSVGNRPVLASVGSTRVLDGFSSPGELDWEPTAEASRAVLEVRDAWKVLEASVFAERTPLDGLTFEEAVRFLVGRSGVTDVVVTDSGLRLPFAAGAEAGDWSLLIEPGDSAGEWLQRLMETFAGTWSYGFRPTATGTQFFALADADLPSTPTVTLYGTTDEAVTVGGVPPGSAYEAVYRSFRQTTLEPEATEVRVTGVDPLTGRPIQAVKTDYAAQDVTVAPGSRPANWLGEIRRFGLVDAGLTLSGAVESACQELFDKLTKARVLAEFECGFLLDSMGVPLWRGDLVELYGFGTWRILSFGCRFESEAAGMVWRRGHYTVEKVSA